MDRNYCQPGIPHTGPGRCFQKRKFQANGKDHVDRRIHLSVVDYWPFILSEVQKEKLENTNTIASPYEGNRGNEGSYRLKYDISGSH